MTSFKPADLFKLVGVATGGQASTLTAAGAVSKVSGAANTYAEKIGAKIGIYTGGSLFASLAKGAQRTDTAEVDALTDQQLGYSVTDVKTYALLAALAIGAWLLFRRS